MQAQTQKMNHYTVKLELNISAKDREEAQKLFLYIVKVTRKNTVAINTYGDKLQIATLEDA